MNEQNYTYSSRNAREKRDSDEATVTLGVQLSAELAAQMDLRIDAGEFKNRSVLTRKAIKQLLSGLSQVPKKYSSAFEALLDFASSWEEIQADCKAVDGCSDCPVFDQCMKGSEFLLELKSFFQKIKTVESKEELQRLMRGLEKIERKEG